MTLAEIERALAAGELWAAMRNGAYWRVRRNGATRLWRRDPLRFRVPVKAGLKACGAIDQNSSVTAWPDVSGDFVISAGTPLTITRGPLARGVI